MQRKIKRKVRPEHEVGSMCDMMAELLGWTVEKYEETRGGRRLHRGLPDRRYVKPGVSAIWVELKATGGKLRVEQYPWLMAELDSGGLAVVIDDEATLVPLLKDAASTSSMVRSSLRAQCRGIIELTSKRGLRTS
jgi:hypothetical protein